MTDLEISKQLALAIGHQKSYVNVLGGRQGKCVWVQTVPRMAWSIRIFDYRDWAVIGPIAERYDAFPRWNGWSWECIGATDYVSGNTPQKAIALAVINGAKKC